MDRDLLAELALLRDLGFTHLDIPKAAAATGEHAQIDAAARTPVTSRRQSPPAAAPKPRASAAGDASGPATGDITTAESLDDLCALSAACNRCRLARGRTQVVYGVGNSDADLMFVGEAPGRDEDLQGEPFVGRAGQLLTDIIRAMKLSREMVYIGNVIKCRPPENRNPEPDELDACRPLIRRQIELIKPRVIVTLGRFALQSLTERAYSISSLRGKWLAYGDIKLMPTYHPAYLLRNPAAKKDVWADMKKVMAELGIEA
ncbi:MAG TPA: uracil-DNA glycosylase [Thermoanaerobaculia bacterium]|nr:uracil-DNA glycosylase [Thermoanaerobaculia bacterium]